MGMSASQARLIQLEARQSNLEYQGQQINQERAILSQQCTDLYNSLLNMSVPTPPSTSDYTTIQYTGIDGASKFTLGSITPNGSLYNVNIDYKRTGNVITSGGKAQVTDTPQKIKLSELSEADKDTTVTNAKGTLIPSGSKPADGKNEILHYVTGNDIPTEGDVYVNNGSGSFTKTKVSQLTDAQKNAGVYTKINRQDAEYDEEGNLTKEANYTPGRDYTFEGETPSAGGITLAQISNYYVVDGDKAVHAKASDFDGPDANGKYTFRKDSNYFKVDSVNGKDYGNPDFTEGIGKSMNGSALLEWSAAKERLTSTQIDDLIKAMKNANSDYKDLDADAIMDKYYVFFSQEGGQQVPHFVAKTEITTGQVYGADSQWAEYHTCDTSGSYTETITQEDCQLTFDTSGRIIKIGIPTLGKDGTVNYRTIDLEASKVTDEAAYQDAYNQYEYATYEYDKKQQEINAKTEIIQQQDRNLELKLQRLDNERQQITTEIEAVKKVITDNIESSYKTFSG